MVQIGEGGYNLPKKQVMGTVIVHGDCDSDGDSGQWTVMVTARSNSGVQQGQ